MRNYVELIRLVNMQLRKYEHTNVKKFNYWNEIMAVINEDMLDKTSLSGQLKFYGIRQNALARELKLAESTFALYLSGYRTMPEWVEKEVEYRLDRAKEEMDAKIEEDKHE